MMLVELPLPPKIELRLSLLSLSKTRVSRGVGGCDVAGDSSATLRLGRGGGSGNDKLKFEACIASAAAPAAAAANVEESQSEDVKFSELVFEATPGANTE